MMELGAFEANVILSVLIGVGAVLLVALLVQHFRLLRETTRLEADIALAETAAGLGYWSRKTGAPISKWSDGLFRIFGEDPARFVPYREIVIPRYHPDDIEAVLRLHDPVATEGRGGDVEARIAMPDGSTKHVLVATRYRYAKGKLVEMFGIVVDITARKAAEMQIAVREEQLQRAIIAMGAAVWEVDAASGAMTASPRWAEILGHDPSHFRMTAEMHRALLHPDDLNRVEQAFRAHVVLPAPLDIEYRMQRRRGGYAWVHVRGRLQDDRRKAVGTVVDVTERRVSAERQAKQAREATLLHEGVRLTTESASLSGALRAVIDMVCTTIRWPVGHAFVIDETGLALRSAGIWRDDDPERYGLMAERNENMRFAPGVGLPGEVWLAERPIWVANAGNSSSFEHLKGVPGLGAAVAFPIRVKGETLAVVEFFAGYVHNEDEDLLRVFESLGLQIGNVIERQKTDEELRHSRESLELALSLTDVGYFELPISGPGHWSERARQIFGIKSEAFQLTPDMLTRHIAGEDLPEFLADLEELKMRHTPLDRELRVKLPSGTVLWVHIQAARQFDQRGKHMRTIGFVRDISRRKGAERAMVESERKYRGLVENSLVGLIIHRNYKPLYCNAAYARLLGYDNIEDVLALDSVKIHRLEAERSEEAETWEAIERGEYDGRMREFTIIDRHNRLRYWEVIGQLVDWDGSRAIQSMVVDVTERVEREIELAAARDRMKQQADELSSLAQTLDRERTRAEEANAAKSRFLAMMSHELRTPMTGILGMADLLRLSGLSREQQELNGLLTNSARTLLDLLNDILDFSKIEAGHLEIESVPFRLNEIITDVTRLFGPVAAEKGLTLETDLPGTFWNALIGDPKRLRQVLSNLIGNAIKFTPHGGIVLQLKEETAGEGGLWLHFTVSDTGVGIAPEAIERLFKPFSQAEASTSRTYGGTGLGLAICKRLVNAMGGDIAVESVQGEGSKFRFSVRVGHNRLGGTVQRETQDALETIGVVDPLRILVAEDNETSRRIIYSMLTRFGHTVETVNNGAEALSAVIANDYDVVLMDMQMPVMDGPDATRAIRALAEPRSGIPVIALTADVVAANRNGYFAAGVNAIVPKPIDWQELSRELAKQTGAAGKSPAALQEPAAPILASEDPPANMSNAVVLDEVMLKSLVDALGEEILAPMVTTFRNNMIQYRDDLSAAVAAGDLKKAKRTAHALKGLCAQFGAPRASSAAKIIEVDSKSLAEVEPMLGEVADAVAATEQALATRFPGW